MGSSVFVCLIAFCFCFCSHVNCQRAFTIDYENNQFLKDGKPFRYISGSIHYFRVPRIYWLDRLEKMKAAGLNAIQTYIDWSQHEPYPGVYNFQDNLDVVSFISLAQKLGLLVILRPGPYIDAERDLGGLPFWLLQKKSNIYLRSNDPTYIKYVDLWYGKVLKMLKPLLYANGGPIISVQVENEFGSYSSCDFDYTSHMRDLIRSILGNKVILFTTDGSGDSFLKCGKIDDVFSTVDFGPGTNVTQAFRAQRNHQSKGPLVNSEYYPGWLDHWSYPHASVDTMGVLVTLEEMLLLNASVNMYMFHGGTNFGFTNGGNTDSTSYVAITTSYDYDAPISEAGDPTPKYFAIRKLISNVTKLPKSPVPKPVPKYAYGKINMKPVGSLFDLLKLIRSQSQIVSKYPVTFESLGQAYGFMLYETIIGGKFMDPAILSVPGVRDRAIIFVDEVPVGILSRQNSNFNIPLSITNGQKLSILVENMGRICYAGSLLEFKGIVSNVTLNGNILTGWAITPISLNDSKSIDFLVGQVHANGHNSKRNLRVLPNNHYYTPGIFVGSFVAPNNQSFPLDTFLDPTGWHKGVVFVNGFNLGRYWPIVGPQITLYLPKSFLKPYPTPNSVVMVELENAPCYSTNIDSSDYEDECSIKLVDVPVINGPTPYKENSLFFSRFRRGVY